MENLVDVADRLRIVREAQRRFLGWWRVEQELIDPLVDRVAAALVVMNAAAPAGLEETGSTDGADL